MSHISRVTELNLDLGGLGLHESLSYKPALPH